MRVAVLGPGALGSLIGAYLLVAGKDVVFIARPGKRFEALKKQGLRIRGYCGEINLAPQIVSDVAGLSTPELILLTVKAYDTESVLTQHAEWLRNALVLSLQNGMGHIEMLQKVLGKDAVLAGSATIGAYLDDDGVVHHAGQGEILLGEPEGGISERAESVARMLHSSRLSVRAHADMRAVLFAKLAVNAAINPITALLGCKNGLVVESLELRELVERILAEVVAVAGAEGVALSESVMLERIMNVARKTAENRSSMLADLLHGKPTEVEAIAGTIVRLGRKHHIPTPFNETMRNLIKVAASRVEK